MNDFSCCVNRNYRVNHLSTFLYSLCSISSENSLTMNVFTVEKKAVWLGFSAGFIVFLVGNIEFSCFTAFALFYAVINVLSHSFVCASKENLINVIQLWWWHAVIHLFCSFAVIFLPFYHSSCISGFSFIRWNNLKVEENLILISFIFRFGNTFSLKWAISIFDFGPQHEMKNK